MGKGVANILKPTKNIKSIPLFIKLYFLSEKSVQYSISFKKLYNFYKSRDLTFQLNHLLFTYNRNFNIRHFWQREAWFYTLYYIEIRG
jgi:hypothetical protein